MREGDFEVVLSAVWGSTVIETFENKKDADAYLNSMRADLKANSWVRKKKTEMGGVF